MPDLNLPVPLRVIHEQPMKLDLETLGAINLLVFIQVLDQPKLRRFSKRVQVTWLQLQSFELLIQEHVLC